jgi:hypothetical protein
MSEEKFNPIAFDVDEVRTYHLRGRKNNNGKWTYPPDADKVLPFQIGVLDARQYNHIRNMISKENPLWAIEAVRIGLKGFSGLVTKKGDAVKFESENITIPGLGNTNVVTDKCLNYIKHYIDELAIAILSDAELTDDESKNSELP